MMVLMTKAPNRKTTDVRLGQEEQEQYDQNSKTLKTDPGNEVQEVVVARDESFCGSPSRKYWQVPQFSVRWVP